MRVLLVGSPSDRARLRSQLNGPMEIAGEFATLPAARASEIDADAIVFAPGNEGREDPGNNDNNDNNEHNDAPVVDEPLTQREIQVLELLAEGLANKAIALRLGISDQTVKFHVSSISGKLGARNRTDAVRRAVRRGLITL
jgi:DNA-binding NarL/FixJ family response regulator